LTAAAKFDPRAYWEERLARRCDLAGVGHGAMGEAFNTWMYRVRARVFDALLASYRDELAGAHVLDVGAGTGFYVARWVALGAAHVTGFDLTDVAVAALANRYPGHAFHRVDVGGADAPDLPPLPPLAAVSCMDVLFHLVDDAAYERALARIHGFLRPRGLFVLTEGLPRTRERRARHVVFRRRDDVLARLDAAGFDVLARRPVFVLMNEPVGDAPLLGRWWRLLGRVVAHRPALGAAAGAALYPVETALVTRLREGPSAQIVLCRRRT
jgi:SAM-dependent methyltransferase